MDIYENISNMEILLSKQLVEECEKEFNISPYDMSYPISASLQPMYNNKKETMEIVRTVIRKRDGIFAIAQKLWFLTK